METTSIQTWMILAILAGLALIAAGAWFVYQKNQSKRLQNRFGPEYGRAVDGLGSRMKAESELKAREKRVEHLHIVDLTPSDAARFGEDWRALQGRFVDNPKGAVMQADQLVRQLLLKRGYPIADFEHRAADISVDHPSVVANYRAAQTIAARSSRGEADTEDLRKAIVHYRALFNELLAVKETGQASVPVTELKAVNS